MKAWYDGFTFGNQMDIYNPWSIINYLRERRVGTYWANTSSNSLVGTLIQEGDKSIKQDFEQLLQGKKLKAHIDEQIAYRALSGNQDAIWSLLLASGYLKIAGQEYCEEAGLYEYTVALTNREVKLMFEQIIRGDNQ